MNQKNKIEQLNNLLNNKELKIKELTEYANNLEFILKMNNDHNNNSIEKCMQLILDLEDKNKELLVSINSYKLAKISCDNEVVRCKQIVSDYKKEYKRTKRSFRNILKKNS